MKSPILALALTLLLRLPRSCDAVLPTAAIDVYNIVDSNSGSPVFQTLLASQASFGTYPAMGASANSRLTPVFPPDEDALLCNTNYSENDKRLDPNTALLVPRGTCTFEQKALNAQYLGAAAIIIYGTLGSRYSWNETTNEQIWPVDKYDYDCTYGASFIDPSSLTLNPYQGNINDVQLTGPNSLCAITNPDYTTICSSQRCLLTGNSSGTKMEACCAWDLHVWLYNDPSLDQFASTIQAFYITMEESEVLMNIIAAATNSNTVISVAPYSRPRPMYNISAVLIWALGVFVAWLASYLSAYDYRRSKKIAVEDDGGVHTESIALYTELIPEPEETQSVLTTSRSISSGSNHSTSGRHSSGDTTAAATQTPAPVFNHQYGEETLELTWHHAIAFLVFSSASLLVLFFFKLYSVVKIMYGIGCSGALMQVIFLPLYTHLQQKCFSVKTHTNGGNHHQGLILFHIFGEPVTLVDALVVTSAYGIGIAWIVVGFMVHDPSSIPFYWITQDVMGACMCIVFLGLIRLNSIKVATILLVVAFVYDVFFVFLSPLIFQKSVMITVATSGGPPTADPTWCEKYPDDAGCQGGEPLPMLFAIPRLGDYEGGASLLGLGDVVLPGLLLSLACRLDCAKRLVGLSSGGRGVCSSPRLPIPCCKGLCNGYFYPVLVAYALGLMMANLAVYIMNMGQPALLYLVPMCLGTMCVLGWINGEITDLWQGPKVLASADRAVASREYSVHHTTNEEDVIA